VRTAQDLWTDPELLDLIRTEPELVAVADALACARGVEAQTSKRHRALAASMLASITAAAAAVLLLVSPWQGSGSLVDKALAAIGHQDVLYVVIEREGPPPPGQSLIDIRTGETITRSARTEIWFDDERDLKKTITSVDGKTLGETLETREGGWSQGGPIYTCAWIAAHPVAATKARVSCNPSGENGTTPRKIPERPPTLDQALAGFVDGYQSALASGQAEQIGTGELDGRDVIWLRIEVPVVGAPPGAPPRSRTGEEVAIDADTHKPLLVRHYDGAVSFRVLSIETVPHDSSLFSRPELVAGQAGGNVSPGVEVDLEQAASILGRQVLWLGREWRGLRLVETTRHRPTITYWRGSERRRERADVIRLTYAPVAAAGSVDESAAVEIYEATTCVLNVGMTCSPLAPREGQLLLGGPPPLRRSFLRRDGLYVAIWNSDLRGPTPLDIARGLHARTTG
jgi:hypothetical protein